MVHLRSGANYARFTLSGGILRGSLERGESLMKLKIRLYFCGAVFAGALLSAPFSGAQQKPTPTPQLTISYDLNRETLVQGTVVSFAAASTVPPIGPHATIQTSSGIVDVHLGNAAMIKINDMFLAPGDSVKIVGESHDFGNGTIFLARILQKGNQTVTLRNLNGIPLTPRRAGPVKARSAVGGAQ